MKKLLKILILASLFIIISAGAVYADGIKVIINNELHNFTQEPFMENDRVMIPIRDAFEAFGAQVSWDETLNEATAVKDNITVVVRVGDYMLFVNGKRMNMDCPAIEKDDHIYISVRFAAQAFDYSVSWDDKSNTVIISDKQGYDCYVIEGETVPKFDSVIKSATYIEDSSDFCEEGEYAYLTSYEDVTDYVMVLQNAYGYTYYTTQFNEDGSAEHIYKNSDTNGVVVICAKDIENIGYTAIITPTIYGTDTTLKTESDEDVPEEENEGSDKGKKHKSEDSEKRNDDKNTKSDAQYYDYTGDTVPTFTYITGVELVEKTEGDNSLIYKYNCGFMEAMQYETALTMFCGYTEYNTDLDFGTITTYYTNGKYIIGVVNSMFNNEVWVITPKQ